MKLKSLTLKNIKCYKHLDLSFEEMQDAPRQGLRQKTVFLGSNGSGKSTILKSIALLLSGSSALGEILGKPDRWVNNKAKKGSIKAELLTAKGESRIIELQFAKGDTLSKLISKNKATLDQLDDALSHAERNYLCVGYGIHRNVGLGGMKNRASNFKNFRSENVATLFSSTATLIPLESWLMDLDYRKGAKGLTKVKKGLKQLLPNAEFKKINKKNRTLEFKTKDGIVEFGQLSDGFQLAANWLGDLMYRISNAYEDYSDPFKARFILLIDEIALHLHPAWQRLILDSISDLFPNAQIIATTHSPFVAQQAREGELYSIIRENSKIEVFHYENDPRKLLLHQVLISDIFGLPTDESVVVEEYKNSMRRRPTRAINKISRNATAHRKSTSEFKKLMNVDDLRDLSINYYTEEKNKSLSALKEELKKMRNEAAKKKS